jgi:metal-responsive CopG/Arc/MetJ family transcriptional regulator
MVRTQIYLTFEERDSLQKISEETGKKQSELIREAVDEYVAERRGDRQLAIIEKVSGIWENRKDILDYDTVRKEWDRRNTPWETS